MGTEVDTVGDPLQVRLAPVADESADGLAVSSSFQCPTSDESALLMARLPPTEMVLAAAVPPVKVPPETVNAPVVATVVVAPLTVTVPPEIVRVARLTLVFRLTEPVLITTSAPDPPPVPGTQPEQAGDQLQLPLVLQSLFEAPVHVAVAARALPAPKAKIASIKAEPRPRPTRAVLNRTITSRAWEKGRSE